MSTFKINLRLTRKYIPPLKGFNSERWVLGLVIIHNRRQWKSCDSQLRSLLKAEKTNSLLLNIWEKKIKIEKLTPVSAGILKKLVTGLLLSKLTLASAQHALINRFFLPLCVQLEI